MLITKKNSDSICLWPKDLGPPQLKQKMLSHYPLSTQKHFFQPSKSIKIYIFLKSPILRGMGKLRNIQCTFVFSIVITAHGICKETRATIFFFKQLLNFLMKPQKLISMSFKLCNSCTYSHCGMLFQATFSRTSGSHTKRSDSGFYCSITIV